MSNATEIGIFVAVRLVVIMACAPTYIDDRHGPALEGRAMARTKGPNRIDAHVGSRLRMRRIEKGMSQEKLAVAFGLTFQQVQKYEKGMNRMGSSRLQHAASILSVPVSYFFEGGADGPFESPSGPSPSYVDGFVGSEDGLRLIKAFIQVRPALQRRIVALANEIAGEDGDNGK